MFKYSRFISLTLVSLSTFSYSANALESKFFMDTQSVSFSEIAPIKQLVDSLKGPMIDRGEVAFSANKVSYGQSFNFNTLRAEIGYAFFSRIDYSLKFSPDTAYIIYSDENNIALENSHSKNVDLRANHIKADGVTLFYTGKQFNYFDYQVGISYLKAKEMLYGRLNGDLTTLDTDTQGNLLLDYHYSEDVFFDREKEKSSAQGYSLDFSVSWQYYRNIRVEFEARDVFSKISWSHQQQTVASANSERMDFDSDGIGIPRAALAWRETNSQVDQELPQQFRLRGQYQFTVRDSVVSDQFIYDGHDFHRLGYRRHFWSQSFASAYYDFTSGALSFEVEIPYFKFAIISDDTDYEQAKIFGFQLSLNAPFNF